MSCPKPRVAMCSLPVFVLVSCANSVLAQPAPPAPQVMHFTEPDGKELAQGRIARPVFRDDGRYLLASSGRNVMLWNIATGKRVRLFQGHRSMVYSVSFSPDGTRVLTGGGNPGPRYLIGPWDFSARIFDVATGKQLAVCDDFESYVVSAQYSPNGKQIVTVANREAVPVVWNAETFEKQFELDDIKVITPGLTSVYARHRSPVKFSPDSSVIVGMSPGELRQWDATTGELRWKRTTTGSRDTAEDGTPFENVIFGDCSWFEFNAEGSRILASVGGKIRGEDVSVAALIYDSATGRIVQTFRADVRRPVAVYCNDDKNVLTAADDKIVRLWETETGKEIRQFKHLGRVHEMVASPDGKRLVTTWRKKPPGNRDYDPWMATLWNVDTGEEIKQFPSDGTFDNLVFSPDSETILVVIPSEKTELLDAQSGKVIRSYE